jgi:murein L,D-transpeptidase YcbB/YkuD
VDSAVRAEVARRVADGLPAAAALVYARRPDLLAWIRDGAPRPVARSLLAMADSLRADGLPRSPLLGEARALLDASTTPSHFATLELSLTALWLESAQGLSGARVTPSRRDSLWAVAPPGFDAVAVFLAAAEHDRLLDALAERRPTHPGYVALRDALARLGATAPPDVVRRIEVNLERWRWLPRRLEPPYVLVNIPAFELRLVERGGAVQVRRVVLGRPDWPTPLLAGTITHVILAPTWTVPAEIARQEVIPAVRADTGYLARLGIQVFADSGSLTPLDPALVDWTAATSDSVPRVRLVQLPGPANPLGRVKFLFDNPLAIYLHDSPATELFAAEERALSHGCVRVAGAMDLAERLLRDVPGWDASRLAEVAAAGVTRSVALSRPVPIHLVYFTAWVDEGGVLQLRDDVYGWDAKLAAALAAGYETAAPSPALSARSTSP